MSAVALAPLGLVMVTIFIILRIKLGLFARLLTRIISANQIRI